MRKKILLYNPKAVFFDMPLALLAIASAIDQEKYEVIIIDGRLEEKPVLKLSQHADSAICLGVTCLTGAPLKDAFDVSEAFKKQNPNIPVVWGGWHTSLFGKETLEECHFVDITVQGQGEQTFSELVLSFEGNMNLKEIKGICYRKEGAVVRNAPRAMVNMDDLPKVNYGLIDVSSYFLKKERRQLDYISSTGCYFRCSFCADPFVFQRKFSAISPERMVEEIKELYSKYDFTDINFQDETFFTYPKRIKEIATGLIENEIKVSWAATMRADQGVRIPEEDYELLVKSGLRRVLIGVESGSQEMMDWLSKDIKIEQVWECARRCKKYGISVIFPFIVGFPNETQASFDASIKMIKQLSAMSSTFETPIFYFKPYPGSKITEEVSANGYELPKSIMEWSAFDYIGSSGPWVSKEKYIFVERFKFYNKLSQKRKGIIERSLARVAKWRLSADLYSWPIEKTLFEKLKKQQKLS